MAETCQHKPRKISSPIQSPDAIPTGTVWTLGKGIGGAAGNGIEAEASGAGTYAVYGKGTALGVIGVRGEGGSGSVGGSFVGGGRLLEHCDAMGNLCTAQP